MPAAAPSVTPRPWAHVPGVTYPAPPPVRPVRPAVPAGCPRLVRSLSELAPWVAKAGLWAGDGPSRRTMNRWKHDGLIVTALGACGHTFIDVPATLARLTPSN